MTDRKLMIDFRHIDENTGFSSYLKMILTAINTVKKDVYILVNNNSFDFDKYLTNNKNVKFVLANSKPFSLKQNIEIPLLLRKYDIDVFHAINYDVPLFMFICSKCRLISTIHDLIPYTHKHLHKRSMIKNIYFDIMYRACAIISDDILTVSNYSKNEIIKHLKVNSNRITVIYNSFNSKNSYRKLKTENNLHEKIKLFFIGSNFEHKNILAVVKAVKLLKDKNINVEFNIAGLETSYTDIIREYIKDNNLWDNINILGKLSSIKADDLYKQSDIFVFPSLIEGFGIPLLEAMNSGLPVISSNMTVMPEIIDNAGILTEPTPENFADRIEFLINNPSKVRELIEKGYERVKYFSQEKFNENIMKFYNSILEIK